MNGFAIGRCRVCKRTFSLEHTRIPRGIDPKDPLVSRNGQVHTCPACLEKLKGRPPRSFPKPPGRGKVSGHIGSSPKDEE